MTDVINRWKAADELYSALLDNEPYEQLKKKIAAHIATEKYLQERNIMQKIYHISMAVSGEETFNNVYKCLREYGIDYNFFNNSSDCYYAYKICSENEADRQAAFNLERTDLFIGLTPLVLVAAIRSSSVSDMTRLLQPYNNATLSGECEIDEYIYYLAATDQTETFLKICKATGISLVAALNIAIGKPDLFYGYLKENYYDKLPPLFRYKNRLRTVEEIIPFLFRSKIFEREYGFLWNSNYVDMVKFLFNNTDAGNIPKIIGYLPKVKSLSISDITHTDGRFLSSEELEIVINHIGRKLTITGYIDNDSIQMGFQTMRIEWFCDKLTKCKIHIDPTLLYSIIKNDSELLDYFLSINADFTMDAKRQKTIIERITESNDAEAVKGLIKARLISPDTLDIAINCAINKRLVNILDVLNQHYNDISPTDTK